MKFKCLTIVPGLIVVIGLAVWSSAGIGSPVHGPAVVAGGLSAPDPATSEDICRYCHASRDVTELIGEPPTDHSGFFMPAGVGWSPDMEEMGCLFYGDEIGKLVKCSTCHEPICREPGASS